MAILTISREYGSGGREIGYAIAGMLDYEMAGRDQLIAEVRKSGPKWESWGRELDEHYPSIWEKYDWSFRGFCALLQAHMLKTALKDNVIIMGRGGNFLLEGIAHALRIRVAAPMDVKLKRIMRRDSVDESTARWLAEKTDKERAGFIRALCDRDWSGPAGYDMVFDAGAKTMEFIESSIKNELIEKDKLKTDKSINDLKMRSIAADIKADILTDPSLLVPTLDVVHEKGQLVLRGVIHEATEHRKIEERARKIAGDMTLRCELHYRIH